MNNSNDDLISRREAIRIASGYCHPANVAKELAKLPSVQSEPERTMEEFMYGQDMGNPEDGSL